MRLFAAAVSLICLAVLLPGCATPAPPGALAEGAAALPARWNTSVPPGAPAGAATPLHLGLRELDGLIATAQQQSPDLAAAVARVQQADAAARAAGAALLPALDASLTASRQARAGGGSSTEVAGNRYGAALGASYELDVWGRLQATQGSAQALRAASVHDQAAVRVTLSAAVAQAWLELVGGRERVAIGTRNLHSAERVLAVVQARARAGAATALELAQQRALVAVQAEALEALRQQVAARHTALALLLGQATPPDVATDTLDALPPPAVHALVAPPELLARRPDIARAEAQLAAARADVAAARAALLPRLQFSAGLATGGSGLARVLDQPVYSLAAALAAPLFDGGRLAAGRDLALAREAELLAQYRAAVVAAVGDVELALQSIAGTDARLLAQAQVLQQAQRATLLAQARYRAGAETLLPLLDAQRTLYAAQDGAAQLRQARWLAHVALLRALGGST